MLRFAQILPAPVTMFLEKRPSTVFRPSSILPRSLRFGLLFLATIAFFFHYNYNYSLTSTPDDPDYLLSFLHDLPKPENGTNPPRFYEWHDREKRLPQHDLNLPYPQGREGRYIRFTNQVWGTSFFFAAAAQQQSHHLSDRPIVERRRRLGQCHARDAL